MSWWLDEITTECNNKNNNRITNNKTTHYRTYREIFRNNKIYTIVVHIGNDPSSYHTFKTRIFASIAVLPLPKRNKNLFEYICHGSVGLMQSKYAYDYCFIVSVFCVVWISYINHIDDQHHRFKVLNMLI